MEDTPNGSWQISEEWRVTPVGIPEGSGLMQFGIKEDGECVLLMGYRVERAEEEPEIVGL